MRLALLFRVNYQPAPELMIATPSRCTQNRVHRVVLATGLTTAIALGGAPGRAWAQPAPSPARPDTAEGSIFGTRPVRPPKDEPTDQNTVRELMRAGTAAYAKNDLEAARAAFAKAWELKQHEAIAANLADVEQKLGHFRDAALHWGYVVEHTSADRVKIRTEAQTHLDECRKHLGALHLTTDPGAALFLDDQAAELGGPGQDLLVEPGNHVLRAELAGRASPSQQFTIGEGEQLTLVLIVPAPQPVPARPPLVLPPKAELSVPMKRESGGNQTRTVVLFSGGLLTAAALGVGIGFTLKANDLGDQADRLRQEVEAEGDPNLAQIHGVCGPSAMQPPAACGTLRATVTEGDHARNTATVAFVAGGVIAVGTVAYYLLSAPHKETANSAGMQLVPWLGEGRRGLELQVTY